MPSAMTWGESMGTRLLKLSALAALLIGATLACAPPPKANAPLVVTTTADTFDGVCDETDCSLRDALSVVATKPLGPSGLPNRVNLPIGDYVLNLDEPLEIRQPFVLEGFHIERVSIDVTGSTVAAPQGLFDLKAAMIVNGARLISNADDQHIFASCDTMPIRAVSFFNSTLDGFHAAANGCETTFVNTVVTGERSVVDPRRVSGAGATLPFDDTTLRPLSFSMVTSKLTGPTAPDGTPSAATLTLEPRPGMQNLAVNFTGTRTTGLGVELAQIPDGSFTVAVVNSSFGLDGPNGESLQIRTGVQDKLRFTNSTVYGGGAAGAIVADGLLWLDASTVITGGPAVVTGPDSAATLRRSVVAGGGGVACTGPMLRHAYNVVIGSGCGDASATDLTVGAVADLQLSELASHAQGGISLHYAPAETSPLVNAIPVSTNPWDPNCPTELGEARGIDARGVWRPSGDGCDIGAIEYYFAPPPVDPGVPADPPPAD